MREAVEFIKEFGDEETIAKVKGKAGDEAKTEAASGNGNMMAIYTDGSSLSNGRLGAVAGVGVFFGTDDPRYVHSVVPLRGLFLVIWRERAS